MRLRTALYLALAAILLAGPGVASGKAQSKASSHRRKASAAKSGASKSSRGKASRRGKRQRGQMAPTSDRITEIQQALGKDGSYSGEPTGKWDDSTVDAMRKFQSAHGLNPSGKIDAKTLQQLGLGSQTAGVAAPMPPVGASSSRLAGQPQTARR